MTIDVKGFVKSLGLFFGSISCLNGHNIDELTKKHFTNGVFLSLILIAKE